MFDLGNYVPYLLNRAGVRMVNAFSRELKHFDISLGMWRVLAALWHSGEQRLVDLAELTSIETSTLSRMVGSMHHKGLITRERTGHDARAVRLGLTPDGRRMTEEIIPVAMDYEAALMRGFSSQESHQLRQMLRRLYDNMADFEERDALSRKPHGRGNGAAQ